MPVPLLLGSVEALGAQNGPREPTHRPDNARCKARSFRHADQRFRQCCAGCATLPTLRSADASRAQNAAVWRIARPTHVRMPEMRDIPYRGRWASKMARHRSVSPLSQTGAGMPPAGYFSSRLRRSLLLASFVRALAEAGPRRWSADKLSAGYQSALTVIAL